MPADLVVCSHRGPFAYRRSRGRFVGRRGGGGLIGAVAPVASGLGATWVAAALSPPDRDFARAHPDGHDEGGFRLLMLDLPPEVHDPHYDVVSNEFLWFLFHYLFDVADKPVFDDSMRSAWSAYREVNRRYAEAVAAIGRSGPVWVQDYHLICLGMELRGQARGRRPLLYFHHTPWCEPDYFSMLPDSLAVEIMESMAAYDVVGFHARRWARSFLACCERFLRGVRVGEDEITYKGRTTKVVVAPVPLDAEHLAEQAASERAEGWVERLEEMRGDRHMLTRIDRIDLSKNPLRGYLAFEALLERRPKLAKSVNFLALQYPSRLKVGRYRRYFADCLNVVRRVNERFAGNAPGGEGPITLHFEDDFDRSLAAMRIYDTLLVNPVFDGLNLVAKEAAVTNTREGVLVLSRNAGVYEEIGKSALSVNPFDVVETAETLERALEMPRSERKELARSLRRASSRTTPMRWARAQLDAAGVPVPHI